MGGRIARPPHPATIVQPRLAPERVARPPHPATVLQRRPAPSQPAARPPHPATTPRAILRSTATSSTTSETKLATSATWSYKIIWYLATKDDPKSVAHAVMIFATKSKERCWSYGQEVAESHFKDENGYKFGSNSWFSMVMSSGACAKGMTKDKIEQHAAAWHEWYAKKKGHYPANCRGYVDSAYAWLVLSKAVDFTETKQLW